MQKKIKESHLPYILFAVSTLLIFDFTIIYTCCYGSYITKHQDAWIQFL